SVTAASPFADGFYTVFARAMDAAGNLSTLSTGFAVLIDTTPPAAPTPPTLLSADDSGTKGDGVTSVKQPHLVGTAEAGGAVPILNAWGTVLGSASAAADGSYSVVLASPLADGTYALRAQALDVAGNPSTPSGAFNLTINTAALPAAPSTPALLAGDDTGVKGDGGTSVKQPHLTGTPTAGLTVQVVNGSGTVLGPAVAARNGWYSVLPASAPPDGTYSLQARAVDASGNVSPPSAALGLVIDTTAPAKPPTPTLLPADDSGIKGDAITYVRQP